MPLGIRISAEASEFGAFDCELEAQAAAAALTAGSDKLLSDSESLFQAFTAFGSLGDTSFLGNVWISIVSGVLALAAIVLLVLGLLVTVMLRFNSQRNPVPSSHSHNSLIEVIWTTLPVIILLVIAIIAFGVA
jgi:hypothetical protein